MVLLGNFGKIFANFFSFNPDNGGIFGAAFTDSFNFPEGSLMTCVMLIITFAMIDMFDTMGTVVGCCANANLLDENGIPKNYDKIYDIRFGCYMYWRNLRYFNCYNFC